MKISSIIPVYNSEKYIEEAVNSILKQTWQGEKEIIIVDDQSLDNSLSVAQSLCDNVISIEHGGAAKARNAGIQLATGDYLFFMDADDILLNDAFDKLCSKMNENSECDVVFGQSIDFISPELPNDEKMKLKPRDIPYGGSLTGSALIKRTAFFQVGYFDENLTSGETVEWMLKLREIGLISKQINDVVKHRRLHMTNTGRIMREEEMKNYASILRKRMFRK